MPCSGRHVSPATLRRAIAGPHRALQWSRATGRGPVAGQKEIVPLRSRGRAVWRSVPASPRTSPAARARSATAAARRQFPRPRHLLPYRLRQLRARHVHQAVGIADRHRQPALEGEDPFGRAVDDADHRRHARRDVDAEMRVGDGAMTLRHGQSGDKRSRGMARHRQDRPHRRGRASSPRRRNRARRSCRHPSATRAVRRRAASRRCVRADARWQAR